MKGALHFLEQLLGSSADGVLAFDSEFRYLFWNAAMERLSGMRKADVLGKCAFELFPLLRPSGEDQLLKTVVDGACVSSKGRPCFVRTTRSGCYETHYSPLRLETGAIVGGIAIIRDVTPQTAAEEQLRETEARFKNMADASPVLLWMSRPDALCTFFNQTWLQFTGRTLEQEWGVGWAAGVHFEDFQHCVDTYIDAFNERRVFEMEYRLRRADGEYRWVLDRGTPRYTPDGNFAGYIGSCVDITDLKRLEGELRQAVSARDEFLSIASHELKTPLTALQLQIQSLARTVERRPQESHLNGRFAQNVNAARRQTERMANMVDLLLDVSRIAEGKLSFEYEELDLTSLVKELIARSKDSLDQAGCAVEFRAEGAVVGRWDRLRLEQVITNLLSNAGKYGAGKPIEVSVEGSGATASVTVIDHGIGISSENQARIFERFERAVSPRHYGGLGLGLWISRQIATALGGSIRVDSVPGQGATFVVDLPRAPVEWSIAQKAISIH